MSKAVESGVNKNVRGPDPRPPVVAPLTHNNDFAPSSVWNVGEVVSRLGVNKFVMMTWLAPLENCSQLINIECG